MFKRSLPAALSLLAFHSLYAADPGIEAPAIVVTATRTAQTVDETLASVTVITRQDIERSQAKTMAELLNGLAGVETSVTGGYGKSTSVYLRGTNADHLVVLVDGVRVGSATLGTVSWQYLPIEQIDRIEIVRGPRSSLYGADAIGGVVQIFTRKGNEGFRAGATAGYGTYRAREYSANASGAGEGTHYSVAAAQFKTDGINARTVAAANESDNDGYNNKSFNTRVGHRFANGAEIQAHLLHAQGNTTYDGSFTNESDFIQNALGAEFRIAPADMWNTKLQVGRSRDETDDFKNGVYKTTYNTDRRLQSWQNDLALAEKQLLTLGIDKQTDRIQSSTSYNATSRDNTGYFAQYQASLGKHDLLVGQRRDDNQAFGTHHTGNLAWGYAIMDERLRLVTSYGTAFKAPTFNQLYYPGIGNPNIKPEESESMELGLRGKEGWGKWNLRAYQTNVDNLIVFQPPTYQAMNIDRARIRGLETEISAEMGKNRASFNVTLLDPRDVGTDKLLPRRAKRMLKLDDEISFASWRLGASWLYHDYRYDDPQNTIRMGGYGLVNLHAQYDLGKFWFLRARVDNLFDKPYQTAATYNSLRRNYFFTVGYQAR